MSSNKTANYQLHLWQPGDDFLRTEFNENNEAIDAALGELAEKVPYVSLMETTVSAAAYQVNLDLSGIDLTHWRKVAILYEDSSPTTQYVKVLLNNNAGSIYGATHSFSASRAGGSGSSYLIATTEGAFPGRMKMLLELYSFLGVGVEAELRYLQISDTSPSYMECGHRGGLTMSIGPSQVTSVNLQAKDTSSALPQGARIRIWGVKKW